MHCFKLVLFTCLLSLLSLLSLVSCKGEDPHPQLKDPIYKFLVDQMNTLKPALEAENKKLEEAMEAYEKTDINTAQRKQTYKEILQMRGRILRLSQEIEYNKIRIERRRVEGRRDYKLAYSKGETWPPPGEFENFMTQHRLRTASKNWSQRVPRLHDRILTAWPNEYPNEKEPGKSNSH